MPEQRHACINLLLTCRFFVENNKEKKETLYSELSLLASITQVFIHGVIYLFIYYDIVYEVLQISDYLNSCMYILYSKYIVTQKLSTF